MSAVFFSKVIREVAPVVDNIYLHVLGEPLWHPDFPELIELCGAHRVRVNITTNGDLLDTPNGRKLLHPTVKKINFSLHAQRPEADLEKVLKFAQNAQVLNPGLNIDLRLWNGGDDNRFILNKIASVFGIGHIPESSDRKCLKIADHIYLNFDRRFEWPKPGGSFSSNPVSGICYGLRTQFAVLVDGTVTICCLDAEGHAALGKLGEQPLTDILNSPRAIAIRQGWNRHLTVEPLCRDCDFRRRFDSENPKLH